MCETMGVDSLSQTMTENHIDIFENRCLPMATALTVL